MSEYVYTRCKHCQTVFRVTQKQLQLADGKVRCGACLSVFKATDSLVRPKQKKATPPPTPTEVQSSESTDSIERLIDTSPALEPSVNEGGLLTASPEAELDIMYSQGTQEAHFPIESYGKTSAEETSEEVDESADHAIHQSEPMPEPEMGEVESIEQSVEDMSLSSLDEGEPELEPSLEDIERFVEDDNATFEQLDEGVQEEVASEDSEPDNFADQELELEGIDDSFSLADTEETVSPVSDDVSSLENQHVAELPNILEPEMEDEAVAEVERMLQMDAESGVPYASSTLSDSYEEPQDESDQVRHADGTYELEQETFSEQELVEDAPLQNEFVYEEESVQADDPSDPSMGMLSDNLRNESLDPDPLDEFDEMIEGRSHKLKWAILTVLILGGLGFGGFHLWTERQTLAWDDTWGGTVHSMCSLLPCELKPRRDVDKIELVQRSIQPGRDNPDMLEFDLILRNNAVFEQPFPVVEVKFTDTNGKVITREQFTPDDYLSEAIAMPSGKKAHILIKTQNPHPGVLGYEFKFH
ncbi:DUF3426 domain-containing protein [Pleionea sp. CnH1-48]|uniref:DUF3426 domain-containing protein n=1 Tax=Pleionea sp. CnH1-48 TaxID=2954494 RepID=UPI0020970411|nr:DUF3426 domain-containing protein [Pleionea sp. CnH1-48]MCO7224672.1 DUF3426 domain-containing protein [Pleionea sp. CnH1-48]